MAGHDDELDRRIHDVIGMAQSDAPEPERTPSVALTGGGAASAPVRRWPVHVGLVAAAAVLVFVAVVATRSVKDENAVVPATDISTEPPFSTGSSSPDDSVVATSIDEPSTTVAPSTSEVDPATCGRNAASPLEEQGSIHTVVPSQVSIRVAIDAPAVVCAGATAAADVTLTNFGTEPVTQESDDLVLSSGTEKWVVGNIAPAPLQAGEARTVHVQLQMPMIAPGRYSLFMYGFIGPNETADVVVAGPTVCGGGQLASAVVQEDGASMRQYTVTRLTNQDDVPCVLPRLTFVEGVLADGTVEGIQLQPGPGFFDPLMNPLQDFVLEPGEQADVYLTQTASCLDGTVQPKVYPSVRAQLGLNLQGDTDAFIDLATDVDVACGLWMSDWAEPTAT